MRSAVFGIALAAATAITLSACTSLNVGGDRVLAPKSGSKPKATDEFSTVPAKPIELPGSVASLPPPNKGRPDRAQRDAAQEALAALGGRETGGSNVIPADDRGFVAFTSRLGTDRNIRLILAAEDEEFRRGKHGRLLERWFNVNLYYQAYEPMTLNEYAELERLRNSNIRTPTAPPRDTE